MLKKLKVKSAGKRVQSTKRTNRRSVKKRTGFWSRVWNIICWPFRMIARACRWLWRKIVSGCRLLWKWLCGINVIGLVNLTLLAAIIILFSMLIIDVVGCRKQVVVVAPQTTTQTVSTEKRTVKPRPTLPMRVDAKTNKRIDGSVNVVPVKVADVEVAKKQYAITENKFWGDVIVDSRASGAMLKNKTQVNGNLYLQNMRKYVLPCDVEINGNLFLRDVNMLQFCGDFVVTGNIYVSPRSSFGPIPKTARVGGHVVL